MIWGMKKLDKMKGSTSGGGQSYSREKIKFILKMDVKIIMRIYRGWWMGLRLWGPKDLKK